MELSKLQSVVQLRCSL